MKILFFIPYTSSNYGGTSVVSRELAKKLVKYNVDVDLISTNAAGHEKLNIILEEWIDNISFRSQYFSCWHRNDLIFSPSLLKWLEKNIYQYDIVHTHTIWSPLVTSVHNICKKKRVPYVATPHGMLEPWILSSKSWKKKPYYKFFETPALNQASFIQAIAPSEAETIKSLGFNNVLTIPNGVHAQDFEVPASPNQFYECFPELVGKQLVLFLGRIHPKKGLDILADAFKRIHARFPNTHLVIAGPDNSNFLPTAKRYFYDAKCQASVTFTGMLSGDLKYSVLAAASAYVAPSYSEGFSMSILEGMASGLPCVITKECNFPEAVGSAYVVDANSDKVYAALHYIFSNPQEALEMGKNARQMILSEYTWDHSAKQLSQAYASIIRSSSTSRLSSAF